jgi:hypothetical protein
MTDEPQPASGKSLEMFIKLLGPKEAYPEKPEPIKTAPPPKSAAK